MDHECIDLEKCMRKVDPPIPPSLPARTWSNLSDTTLLDGDCTRPLLSTNILNRRYALKGPGHEVEASHQRAVTRRLKLFKIARKWTVHQLDSQPFEQSRTRPTHKTSRNKRDVEVE